MTEHAGDYSHWAGRTFSAVKQALNLRLAGEPERRVLWLPVFVGIGVAGYFALPAEPAAWIGPFGLGLGVLLLWLGWRHPVWIIFAAISVALFLGFSAAHWRAEYVAAPVLAKRTGVVAVEGTAALVERRTRGSRIVIVDPKIERLDRGETPRRIRITVRTAAGINIVAGDRIRMRAVLLPPPDASLPGGFDFVRFAWFKGIGGVGYAVSPPRIVSASPQTGIGHAIETLRQTLTTRILTALEGRRGAIAAALMTGERGAIPETVLAAMRDAGLAHLLAISGLHIGLLAAILFFVIRAGLALSEPLALRYAIKKWAAAAALAGALAYLVLTGSTVPTQRAFLMTGLVLVAVMLDRRALSMGLVAWAAAAVLLMAPESLLGPSFQMSFSAVIALIAVYEIARDRFRDWRVDGGTTRRLLLYLAGVALTTMVASTATAPFAAYHFGRFAVYGLAANLVAVPIMAMWIMPCAIAAFALMPLGLEGLALAPMGWGIEAVLRVAETVAAWPGAVQLLPAMPDAAIALMAMGGLWLCLWSGRWRLWGIVPILLGLAVFAAAEGPDVLVGPRGEVFAVAENDGRIRISARRKSHLTGEWLESRGQETPLPWPGGSYSGPSDRLVCDGLGCLYRAKGKTVALIRQFDAVGEDCAVADVVISAVPLRRRCQGPSVTVDRFDLWRGGAHAVWLEEGGTVRVRSVADERGQRLWSPLRSRPREKGR